MALSEDLMNFIRKELQIEVEPNTILDELHSAGWDDRRIATELIAGSRNTNPSRFWVYISAVFFCFFIPVALFNIYAVSYGAQVVIPQYTFMLPTHSKDQARIFEYGASSLFQNESYTAQTVKKLLEQRGSFVFANLTDMYVSVYTDGEKVVTVPIATKGREGSWWETPSGVYEIETREIRHYSGMGHVNMPYSMRFQGNFYIHGWPTYSDGTAVSSKFSGGCIRMKDEDAKQVYDYARIGMPIIVYEKQSDDESKRIIHKKPAVSAEGYAVADIASGQVLVQREYTKQFPIASVTKLMTALIATEYIDLDAEMVVSNQAAQTFTSLDRLRGGEKVRVYDALFPLLLESSNELAESIAEFVGRQKFISLMNKKTASIGMSNTVFADPSGAVSENISTVYDLMLLLQYVVENRSFLLKATQGVITRSAYGDIAFSNIRNFNDFGDDPVFLGGKVGKTTAAKESGVYLFEMDFSGVKRKIGIIVLRSDDRKKDALLLKEYALHGYSLSE